LWQFTFVGLGVVFEKSAGGPLQTVGRRSQPPTFSVIRTARPALAVLRPGKLLHVADVPKIAELYALLHTTITILIRLTTAVLAIIMNIILAMTVDFFFVRRGR
jgi:hypothetical protein